MPRKKYPRNAVRDEINLVINQRITYVGEDVDVELAGDSAQEAWGFIAWLDHYIAAANAIRDKLRIDIAHEIGERGAVRFGESLLRYNQPRELGLLEAFDAFAKSQLDAYEVLAILPRRGFRVTALRKIAEAHGLDPEAIEGTFYINTKEDAEPTVTVMPMSNPRIPKYALAMKDGEIRYGKTTAKKPVESVTPSS